MSANGFYCLACSTWRSVTLYFNNGNNWLYHNLFYARYFIPIGLDLVSSFSISSFYLEKKFPQVCIRVKTHLPLSIKFRDRVIAFRMIYIAIAKSTRKSWLESFLEVRVEIRNKCGNTEHVSYAISIMKKGRFQDQLLLNGIFHWSITRTQKINTSCQLTSLGGASNRTDR